MPTKWYLSRKWRACEKHFCALSIVSGPSGVHPIFGKAGSVVKIWLLQNAIAFWGIKVQIVPYHFVSKQIPCAHPFCRLFSMPPILCLEKAGSDPMGLISTGIFLVVRRDCWGQLAISLVFARHYCGMFFSHQHVFCSTDDQHFSFH